MTVSTECIVAAFISTGLISLVPNVLLFLFPQVANRSAEKSYAILSFGQALAAGGLLGDVFLHTMPHAFADAAQHGDDAEMDWLAIVLLGGFVTFYIVDVLVRLSGAAQSHSHSHGESNGDLHKSKSSGTGLSSAVILNLAADSLHNFTDGLAIGASYASAANHFATYTEGSSFISRALSLVYSRSGLVSVSVLFHEIPHEIGDFSVLVSHGFTKLQAINLQFLTAVAALCGTAVGIASVNYEGDKWMMPFTAGGFVYVAAVTILPELLQETKGGAKVHFLQVVFFVLGVAFMQGVALLEHHEHHHHQVMHDEH